MAGSGRFEQARALLAAYPLDPGEDAAARAYLLTVRAELQERAQSIDRAIADYSAALTRDAARTIRSARRWPMH